MLKFLSSVLISIWAFGFYPKAFAYEWDLIVYMQADNDLAAYAVWDLLEMENSESLANPNLRVRVIADFPGEDGYRLYNMEYTNHAEALAGVEEPKFNLELVESRYTKIADESKNQLNVLESELSKVYESNNSKHTMLIIWGHGEGWSFDREAQFGGIALDDSPKSRIAIGDLAAMLGSLGRVYDRKLDILAFDACLMQTLEVAYEFLDITTYMIGSTQIQSFRGLPYTEVLDAIGESSPYEITQKIPELVKSISSEKLYNDYEFTISAYNLEEVFFQFIPSFGLALDSINNYLIKNPIEKIKIKLLLEKLPKFLGSSRDLGIVIGALESYFHELNEPEVLEYLRQAYAGLRRGVVSSFYGEKYQSDQAGHYIGYFKALGIWFPHDSKNYQSRIDSFSNTKFYQSKYASSWNEFVKKLYQKTLVFGF